MPPYYDPRVVPAHGVLSAKFFLINEAPGPCEAHYGIPSVGAQGGNIYRSLRKANVAWASNFLGFHWPVKVQNQYKKPSTKNRAFQLRKQFLNIRQNHITCTNAYHLWPRSSATKTDWVDPNRTDVLSQANIQRISNEIHKNHSVILICGEFAWLACYGASLQNPASHEGRLLTTVELNHINQRLNSSFQYGWYMGHTRRWSLNSITIKTALTQIRSIVPGW